MGKAFCNNIENPQSAQIIIGDFCFFAGKPNKELIENFPKDYKSAYLIMIGRNAEHNKLIEKVYKEKANKVSRYAIKKEYDVFDKDKLQRIINNLDKNIELRLIDEEIYNELRKNQWSKDEHIIEASQNGDLIIYIKNKRINKRGEHVSELVTGLKIVSDYIVEKDSKSVFSNDKLESILKDNNIETIEVNGIDGCCCVAATALDAVEKGYNVIFPLKYIGTLNEERFITKIRSKLLKSEINII